MVGQAARVPPVRTDRRQAVDAAAARRPQRNVPYLWQARRCSWPHRRLLRRHLQGGSVNIRSMIERAPADGKLLERIGAYKALRSAGWDVTALVAPDRRSVVFMACQNVPTGATENPHG